MAEQLVNATVYGKLRRLRAALRGRLLGEGLAWLALALVALVFVTLGFDYLLRLDRAQRAIVMLLALGGVGCVLWRELLAPMFAPMRSDDLALLVERRHGELGDRLISALQFARTAENLRGQSPAMVRRVADEANRLAEQVDVAPLVERRLLVRRVAIAAWALALLAGFTVWRSDVMGLWLARNVAFADTPWPQDTYLSVEGGPDFTVVRGDDLTVRVVAEPGSVRPDYVTVHARYPSVGGETQDRVDPAAPGVYEKTFAGVSEAFTFHVTGGDDRRDADRPHRVRLIDPPALRDVRFSVEYPTYMDRAAAELAGGRSAVSAPAGGAVTIVGVANKDLAEARMVLDDADAGAMRIADVRLGEDAAPAPRRVLGRLPVDGPSRSQSMILRFELTDTDGYTSRRGVQYLVQVAPDLSPTVKLSRRGVGGTITPDALLPLRVEAEDDNALADLTILLSAEDVETLPETTIEVPPGLRRLDVSPEVDLQGLGLEAGGVLSLQARATDTLPERLGGPNETLTEAMAFRLVTPEELMAELVRRQKEVRVDFVEAIALQEETRAKTGAVAATLEAGEATAEQRQSLKLAARMQQDVGGRCAAAAQALSGVLTELIYNRLGTETDRENLRGGVIEPLQELTAAMGQAAAALNDTDRMTGENLAQQVADLAAVQEGFVRQMEAILENMEKLASRQELANELKRLINASQELLERIRRRQEEEVEGVFDGDEE